MEHELIFKAYLRGLKRDLIDIDNALTDKDPARAKMLLESLIKDTEADIKDK